MSIWINQDFCDFVKDSVIERWPEKRVKSVCVPRSWQSSRFIQVSTFLKDMDIHYEVTSYRVQFHIEGKFCNSEYKPFLRYLRDNISSEGELKWRNRNGMTQGACEVDHEPNDWEEVINDIEQLTNAFDPLIKQYVLDNPELFPNQMAKKIVPKLSYKLQTESENEVEKPSIKAVGEIPFDLLTIPTYQRPYKWTAKNVNQLISDILTFCAKNKKHYRLGTLVLHNNEIVDGQQRIVTLTLILSQMLTRITDEKKKEAYKDLVAKLKTFSENAQFPNRYSLHNVVENIHVIEARENDLDEAVLDFIVKKCEFVVIQLNDISEAFQFFDSQNARGKDLEPHDLLKAYHLREIIEMTDADSQNIYFWQDQRTSYLKEVFLTLYRAKRWSQGKTARYFSKSRVDIFKGISLRDGKRYPFYQMEVIAHIFANLYNSDPTRYVDQRKLEYPFNLDDQIINGSRFFDMIRHYMALYETVKDENTYPTSGFASDIFHLINNYNGMSRTGDQYVKSMFFTLVLYYLDRFGIEELDKVVPKFFVWAYSLRLASPAVQLATIDNYATEWDSMLRKVHDAKTPYDIINLNQEGLSKSDIRCTKCEEVIEMFRKLKKIYDAQ